MTEKLSVEIATVEHINTVLRHILHGETSYEKSRG